MRELRGQINSLFISIKKSNKLKLYYILTAAVVLCSIFGIFLPAATSLIILSALMIPLKNAGILLRCIIVLFLASCMVSAAGFLFWILKLSFTPQAWLFIYTLIISIFILRGARPNRIALNSVSKLFPRNEAIAIICVVFIAVPLLMPVLQNQNLTAKIRQLSVGEDNLTHYGILRAIDNENGYIYKNADVEKYEIAPGANLYPQAWHLNMSLAEKLVLPKANQQSSVHSIGIYLVFCVINYLLLIFQLIYLGLSFCSKIGNYIDITVSALLVSILTFSSKIISLLSLGFHPQIYALSLMLAALVLIMGLERNYTKEDNFRLYSAALIVSGISFSYLLFWPSALLAAVICFIRYSKISSISFNRGVFAKIFVFLGIGLLQPILFFFFTFKSYPGFVNFKGSVVPLDLYVIFALSFLSLLFYSSRRKWKNEAFIYFLISALLSSCVIAGYQLATIGEPEYYFYKSVYMLYLLASIILLPLVHKICSSLTQVNQNIRPMFASLLLLLAFGLLVYPSYVENNKYAFKVENGVSQDLAETLASQLGTYDPSQHTEIVLTSCRSVETYTGTRLAMALTLAAGGTQRDLVNNAYIDTDSPYEYQIVSTINSQLDSGKPLNAAVPNKLYKKIHHASSAKYQYISKWSGSCMQN